MQISFILKISFKAVIVCSLMVAVLPLKAENTPINVRVKDVARFQGVSRHMLTGYGLVVGLNGTGDSDEALTQQTMANVLHNYDLSINPDDLKAENMAAVMVTASFTGSINEGDNIPATVSTTGDASSLVGGTLLLTPLRGPDGEVWAQGQGNLTIGGYSFGDEGGGAEGGESVTKNHPVVGALTNGVQLLRDVDSGVGQGRQVTISLDNPDFTSASNMADAIDERFPGAASAQNAATVKVLIPKNYLNEYRVSNFLKKLEQVPFQPGEQAKVVLNERTGTVVFGGDVKISKVALTHGNITIRVKSTPQVSQPMPLASGQTEMVTQQQTDVETEQKRVQLVPQVVTVQKLVSVLNTLGATPRDIMVIMHTLRDAGALHAKLVSK